MQDFPNSVKELQLATNGDATHLTRPISLRSGRGCSRLNRTSEAADAFGKCAEISSGLQDRCKQLAAQAKGAK